MSDAWTALAGGRPGLVVVEGGRGVGKSALLAAALDRLPTPAVVLRARCTAAERGFAYGMVDQLFDRTATSPDTESPTVLHRYLRVARDLTDTRPVVVAVDDLHLADDESLQWLSFLARRLSGIPLCIVVTVESATDAAREVERMVADVAAVGTAVVLRPEPLCESCVEAVAATLLDGPLDTELAIACHELSRGNPLILREYVNRLRIAGVHPGSPDLGTVLALGATTLADTALQWLDERSPAAAELLFSMALLGPDADTATAAMLVGQGELEAADAVRSLRAAGLVNAGDPARIAGPLVTSAALGRLSAPRRIELHVAAARLLTRLGVPACRAADHLMLVGPAEREWAVDVLRLAAREAVRDARIDAAVRYLRRAAAECAEAAGVLALEIAALELHHDLPSALRCVDVALGRFSSVTERAEGLAALANPILLAEGSAAVAPFVTAAADVVATPDVPLERYLALGAMSVLAGRVSDTPAWVRAAAARPLREPGSAHVADADSRALLAALATLSAANGRGRGRAVRLARRAAQGSIMLGTAAVGATVAASWAEQFDDAALWAGWMVETARARERRGELALALVVRSSITLRVGSPSVALDDAREAIGLADSVHASGLRSLAAAAAAAALLDLDRVEQATTVLDTAPVPVESHPLVRASVMRARGALALRAGDPREALRLFQECGYLLAANGVANPSCLPWRVDVVACHVALGEVDAARAVADDDLRLARRWGAPGSIGRALLARSAVDVAAGSLGQAITTAEEAVAALAGSGLRREHARGCEHLATLYRATGEAADVERADAALRTASLARTAVAGTADEPRVAAVPREARAAGSDAAPVARPPRLTFSEARVTDLVLQGMTNQEAADALCISRRTVDTHLNRIYRKFGINNRAELADLARDHS